jgi:hypothetical protein
MVPISGSRNTSGTIITIPANCFFEGYLSAATSGLIAGYATVTLQGGGTGATGASSTVMIACGQGLQIVTPVLRIWAGNAQATLQFNLNGLTAGQGTAVGFTDEA